VRTLARLAVQRRAAAQPLPVVFPSLDRFGIRPQRATVTMIAAPPGSGKTLLALTLVQKMGLPTLFLSADTDENTIMTRAASLLTNAPQSEIREALRTVSGANYYADVLQGMGHVRWEFNDSPTYLDLEKSVCAFAEAWGDFPQVVVVDNLMNLVGDNENEWMALRESTKVLKRITRIAGSAVFAVHHMSESDRAMDHPSPRRAVQGKINQLPELIISLWSDLEVGGEFKLAAVKNRWGPQDHTGERYATLFLDADRMQWYDDAYQWGIHQNMQRIERELT